MRPARVTQSARLVRDFSFALVFIYPSENRSECFASVSGLVLVLIVYNDVALLDAYIDSILAVRVSNAVAITTASNLLAATWRNADLNVDALWLFAAAAVSLALNSTWIINFDDLLNSTAVHFVPVNVLNALKQFFWSFVQQNCFRCRCRWYQSWNDWNGCQVNCESWPGNDDCKHGACQFHQFAHG